MIKVAYFNSKIAGLVTGSNNRLLSFGPFTDPALTISKIMVDKLQSKCSINEIDEFIVALEDILLQIQEFKTLKAAYYKISKL